MKKILMMMLALVMTMALVGCGDTSKESDSDMDKGSVVENNEGQGIFSSFTTTDVDGNKVDQSLFTENQLTVVDVWGTFCNPCIEAMPEMESLYQKYKDQGVGVVGIVIDVQDPNGEILDSSLETAQFIGKEQGTTYPNIVPPDTASSFIAGITAVPTGFLVDQEGNVVGELYVGARSEEEWSQIIEEALEK